MRLETYGRDLIRLYFSPSRYIGSTTIDQGLYNEISKIIIGEVVTEISPFISRHILAKLVEFYFHTYGFFSENITYSISVCFEK